jgi:hypothetical protein
MKRHLIRFNKCATIPAAVSLTLMLGVAVPRAASAQSADRLSDKEVKTLLEQLDTARDKFEGNLDNKVKDSTIRTSTREISVEASLQDLQDNVKKLKDRFNDDYAASAEAETVLKQTTNIDTYMKNNPTITKGRSEWEKLSANLKALATVYGTTFPLPDGASVRRLNDKETAGAAEALEKSAKDFKDRVESDMTLTSADKTVGGKAAESLAKAADALKSRVEDGKPSTAEAKQVVAMASSLSTFNISHPIPATSDSWKGVQGALSKLEQAFSMIATPPR